MADPAFADSLVTSQTPAPVAVSALPDGRAVVLQKTGAVRIIRNGVLLPTPATTVSVCSDGERGVLGFAPDPLFTANGLVYLYYTRPSAGAPGGCVNRVSRFTMVGDTIVNASEVVLLDNIGSPAGNHNGGDVAVGNDGYLYVSVGDGGCDPRGDSGCAGQNDAAQDLSLLNGKILRIDRTTGAPAPGNPFSGAGTAVCRTRGNTPSTPTTTCREIYAYGLRNPWRIAFDPNTGGTKFHINDVGQGTREEVDLGILGANYGWPIREGQCAQGQNPLCPPPAAGTYTQPITDYPHNTTGDYITGGAFVPNGAWPAAYDGGYLFADGSPGRIFFRNAAGNTAYGAPFATGVGGISDMAFVMEPTGWALYYVLPGSNQVRKITTVLAPSAPSGNLAFAPVSSQRVFDSRDLGADSGPLRAGTSRLVNVVPGRGNHRSALVNITMVRPWNNAFLAVWEPRTTRPAAANLNGQGLQVVANASVVPLDADGNILLFTNSTADVVVDLLGFFDVTDGLGRSQSGRYQPLTPTRAVDTRNAPDAGTNDYTRTPDGSDSVVNVPVLGKYGVAGDIGAVALMVTGVAAAGPGVGNVVAYPHGGAVPSTANLNTNGGGDRRANLVVVPLGGDGSVDLRLRVTADVVVDVVGAFTGAGAPLDSAGTYVAIAANREVDTRGPFGFFRPGKGGIGTVNPTAIPDDAMGITQNIAITGTAGPGFITAFPAGLGSVPLVGNGNATGAGQTRSTMAITVLGGGSVSYFTSMSTDVVVDVTGYFNRGTVT